MKKLVYTLKLIVLVFTITAFVSCSDDDNDPQPNQPTTIAELAAANPDLSVLVEALQRVNLDVTLSSNASTFTVLAPTNAAFQAAGITDLSVFTDEELTNILLNHVISGEVTSTDLTTGYVNTLAVGPNDKNISLRVVVDGNITFNGVASPVPNSFDIQASNGVIHVVDAVITPPTVTDFALTNSDFSILVQALSRFGTTYTDLLSGTDNAPFTVFAPTNTAFENLLKALGFDSLDDVPDATLEAILTYHVVLGANVQSGDLTDALEVATASNNQTFEIDLDPSTPQIIDASPFPANIVATDVQGINGVIHVIDKVILPESIVTALGGFNITAYTVFDSNFTTLGAALEAAGLFETVRDTDNLTVFAPTNASFEAFLSNNGFNSLNDIPSDVLTQTLLYHVIGAKAMASDLSTNYYKTLAQEPTTQNELDMYIKVDGSVVINGGADNGGATVSIADVEATNGVIHVVDAVINLPTVVTFATSDATFSILVEALTRESDFTYVQTLSTQAGTSPAPFTVFAPTNDAFVDLLAELSVSSLDDIDSATLASTLEHHVVAEANVLSADLMDNMTITTLGGDITANVTGGATLTDSNNRVSNIIVVDVQAYNGVVHVIDKVILP